MIWKRIVSPSSPLCTRRWFRLAVPEKLVEPTDSEHWFAIAFPLRDDKDSFLAEYGLRKLGDKYLDGMAVARKMGGEL